MANQLTKNRFSSSWLCRLLIFSFLTQLAMRADQIVYDDALENDWQNWGWAALNYANTSPVHSGSSSISVTMSSGYQGIQLYHVNMDSTPYSSISFWMNGGSSGGQHLQVYGLLNGGGQSARYTLGSVAANTWQQFTVPLSALGVANQTTFSGFVIQDSVGNGQPTFYLDDILLVGITNSTPGTNSPVTIALDALVNRRSISPLIYGLNWASPSDLLDLNFTINRGGGNAETRYNWLLNAHNRASDWFFESLGDGSSTPGAAADNFITNTRNGGAEPMITIPMIGWMPKLQPDRSGMYSFTVSKYGPQTSVDPYRSDAGNGVGTNSTTHTTWTITTNDPNDASFLTNVVFQQGWVQHLTNQWGVSTNGGVRFYIMDNEESIWAWTHRDVHPIGPTMEEIRDDVIAYGGMVKSYDPNALVCMGEEYGWNGFLNSGYDQQNPGSTDRAAHGGADYMPWLLNQVHQHDLSTGQQTIDYFTIHWYPQESNFDGTSEAACLLRNRVTRALWDTNYVDESWINTKIYMIPRMKNWVASNYPGLKIGITEYVYGAVNHINGAIAQADTFGIFGREGLDLSTRWGLPDSTTPTYKAMKMYRNYDGNKSAFGDISVQTTVPQPDNLSAYGAVRTSDGALTIMVLNKDLTNATPIVAGISNFPGLGFAHRWQLTSSNVINQLSDLALTNGVLRDMLPAQSITLFVVPSTNSFALRAGSNNPPGQLGIWLDGQAGQTYYLQTSTDLVNWSYVATNQFANNSFEFFVPMTNSAQFYRGNTH